MIAKKVVQFIGWSFIIAGMIMRFTNTNITGRTYYRGRWENSVLDGKALIFFGLVFLLFLYFSLRKKKKAADSDN